MSISQPSQKTRSQRVSNPQEITNKQSEQFNEDCYAEYRQLKRLFQDNSCKMNKLVEIRNDIWEELLKFQKFSEDFKDEIRGEIRDPKKKIRRSDEKIDKSCHCHHDDCKKKYGSQSSLRQHIRLKHPEHFEPLRDTKASHPRHS